MDIQYVVHSAVEKGYEAVVTLGGKEIKAVVTGFVVELQSLCKSMSKTLHFGPDLADAAKELYKVGAIITSTDTLTTPAPEADVSEKQVITSADVGQVSAKALTGEPA